MDRRWKKLPALAAFLLVTHFVFVSDVQAQSLEARIKGRLNTEQLKSAAVGISVVEITAKGPVELFAYNAATPLGPASNAKLLTTAAAFERYGVKATFKTVLYKVGEDLLLIGGGDPGLGDAKLLKDQAVTVQFEEMAATAKGVGIGQIRDIILDDRVFDDQYVHPNWPADQWGQWYCAPVGGLNFNANCLDWVPKISNNKPILEIVPHTTAVSITNRAVRGKTTAVNLGRGKSGNDFTLTGTIAGDGARVFSTPIHDPGVWTATILRDTFRAAGIQSSGSVRRVEAGETFTNATQVAVVSTPILAVIERANTDSLNMMAEALCKRLGHDATQKPGDWANGPAAVKAYVVSLGVDKGLLELDDGSGLSNKNRIAARAFTSVLAHVAAAKDGEQFVQTLAVPGEDGTLERRFKNLTVGEHVRAKTGHIKGVSTLSGYITVALSNGTSRRFAFSILCNKYAGNVNPLQDEICQEIYEWAGGK